MVNLREDLAVKLSLSSSPARVPVYSDSPQSSPVEEVHPRATSEDSQRVSTPETRNPPERAQLVHSSVSPSSAKSDSPPMLRGLKKSPLVVTRELPTVCRFPTERSKSFKSTSATSKTELTISRPSLCPSARVKPLKQSSKTVLRKELPKGSSILGIKPSRRAVSVPTAVKRVDIRMPEKPSVKKEVSTEKEKSAIKHSPITKAAPTPPKSMPVSYIRASLFSPSSQAIQTQRTPNKVKTRWEVNGMAHQANVTLSRVSDKAVRLRTGETPSAGVLERYEKRSVTASRPASKQGLSSSSTKVEEGRRVPRTVINKIIKTRKETCIPVDNTALSLPKPGLVSSMTAHHTCLATDREILDDSAMSTPDTSSIINSGILTSSYTHRGEMTLTRVSLKATSLRPDELPITGV